MEVGRKFSSHKPRIGSGLEPTNPLDRKVAGPRGEVPSEPRCRFLLASGRSDLEGPPGIGTQGVRWRPDPAELHPLDLRLLKLLHSGGPRLVQRHAIYHSAQHDRIHDSVKSKAARTVGLHPRTPVLELSERAAEEELSVR